MLCLWNGNYEDHDFSQQPGYNEKTFVLQKEAYSKYVGTTVGDFVVQKVEYDWGKKTQRWTVKCTICGRESYVYNASDWRRGKGKSTNCICRKNRKILMDNCLKILDDSDEKKIDYKDQKYIGQEYCGYKILSYRAEQGFECECVECGRKYFRKPKQLLEGTVRRCSHKKINNYTTEDWIGRKSGHLTVIGREGKNFVATCDCGKRIIVRPTDMFTRKSVQTCGSPDCEYHKDRIGNPERIRKAKLGYKMEKKVVEVFRNGGYNCIATKQSQDYGVDVIVDYVENHKLAIQCKRSEYEATVKSVQEVYAGGRFYDCDMFCVISPTGFTANAKIMAAKLGVYLADKVFDYPDDLKEYTKTLLPTYTQKPTVSSSKRTVYTVNGFTDIFVKVCEHYNIRPQTVKYRMKYKGMSLEEAIFYKRD